MFGIYGSLMFFLALTIAAPACIISFAIWKEKAEKPMLWFCYKICCKFLLFSMGIRLKTHGLENIEIDRAAILVSNHQSSIDIPVNAVSYPYAFKFLGKKEAAKLPLFGFVINRICVLIDRKDKNSRKESYELLKKNLQKGISVLLYPEGTRNRTEHALTPFYDGAFRLSVEQKAPIYIQTIIGSRILSSPFSWFDLSPGTLHCYWDKVEPSAAYTLENLEEYKDEVKEIMLSHLNSHGKGFGW